VSAGAAPLGVLSVNVYAMGHVAYQRSLERAFPTHAPEVDFRSVHLSEENRGDLLGRAAYWLLTRRPFGALDSDRDWLRLRSELGASLFLRRYLRRALPRVRPDVLHVHTQSIGLLARDAFRCVPTVVSIDATSAILSRVHPPPAARTYRPIVALERECFAAAAHVVCWSHYARRSVVEDYGVAPERVSVVRPTVPHDAIPAKRATGGGGSRLRLLFVGNDFVRKGGADVVAALDAGLWESCELDVVSNGIDSLPPRDGLRLHRGLVPGSPELANLYASADAFVMPTWEDAFGIVYLEAMAAGLPCIATDVLAVPELVRDGVTGLTVPRGDRVALHAAIVRLRDDPALRARLGDAGRRFVEAECDAGRNCRALAQLFARVAAERAR
jgi:glycosyltransferase involved in cell wall biosynthesis